MLEVLSKIICFLIMAITGFYIIKVITKSNIKLLEPRTLIYIGILVLIQICLYKVQYTITYTLTVFLLNTIVYKEIFKLKLENAIISCSIFTIIMFFSDLIVALLIGTIMEAESVREISIISILSNSLVSLMCEIIIETKIIKKQSQRFYENAKSKRFITNTVFFIFLIIDFSYIAFNILSADSNNITYFSNSIAMTTFAVIAYIFVQNRNNYNELSDEYDNLFCYVQNFEDWIEKEQLNRHEYKNQLAVLRCLTTEKQVKDKIDDILEDSINIEGEVVHKLKELPKGGLKGLMYYKVAIAQKNKIKIEVDVSLDTKSFLNKLSEAQIKVLCKLIGIYFDNAIEASIETRKKSIFLEIYELKNKVNIVISNTFKNKGNLEKINEKGYTTKGEGHGNGLYFANNLVSKNKWLETKQEVIDNYYIQTLTIKKLD